MKTDAQLKSDVEAELEWDPSIDATHVGVMAKGGVVTLTGHLESFAEKSAIERAVSRVAGVQAVAIELDVKLAPTHVRSDTEIAEAAENAIRWHTLIPAEKVRVKVEKGWVTLSGELDWDYQRRAAEHAVRTLIGVRGLTSLVALKPRTTPKDINERIRAALTRQAEREASDLQVNIAGSVVTLSGSVRSNPEREAALGAALSAPGITRVVNDLAIKL
jgi:osmotically-inducible protein OsmY